MSVDVDLTADLEALVRQPHCGKESEVSAARTLLERRKSAERRLQAIDLSRLHRELYDLTWSSHLDELPSDDLERACQLGHERGMFFSLLRHVRMDTYTLLALRYLIQNVARESILKDLDGSSWSEKHQILTRWAWCCAQQRADKTREFFSRKYLCEIGPREKRSKIDREFYALLHFLPHYQLECNANLLLYSYQGDTAESPDFELIDERGNRVGLEVTDAVRDEHWYPEEISGERVRGRIREAFAADSVTLGILRRPEWSKLEKNIDEVLKWLQDVHDGKVRLDRYSDNYINDPLGLVISLRHNESGVHIFSMGDGSGHGYTDDAAERRVSEAVAARIEKKARGGRPLLDPCMLLVYDDVGVPVDEDYSRVVSLIRERIDFASIDRFSEVWLMDDQKCQRVSPK